MTVPVIHPTEPEYTFEYWLPGVGDKSVIDVERNYLPQQVLAVRKRGGAVTKVTSTYTPRGGETKTYDLTKDYADLCGYRARENKAIISGCIRENGHKGRHKDFAGFKFVDRERLRDDTQTDTLEVSTDER